MAKTTLGIAVIDCLFQPFIRQIVPSLKQVHLEHRFNSARLTTFLVMVIVRLHHRHYFIPRRNLIHAFKKLFPLSFTLALAILYVCPLISSSSRYSTIISGTLSEFNQRLHRVMMLPSMSHSTKQSFVKAILIYMLKTL